MVREKYRVTIGPEGYLAPAAAVMGVVLPDAGDALIEGALAPEGEAIGLIAEKLTGAANPAVCVGPLLLWQWSDGVSERAAAVRGLADTCRARIFPMPDYRAKSPRIDPEVEINPNHPSITIERNGIDVCLFVGLHLHFANFALRMIRGATSCYTIGLSDYAAWDEAVVSLRDVDAGKVRDIAKAVRQRQKKG